MAITIQAPGPGQIIQPFGSLSLFVTATTTPLRRVIVMVELPGRGRTELVHRGATFQYEYLYEIGLIAPYTDPMTSGAGFAYTIRRRFGWPDGVVNLRVTAYDTAGGEALL